MTRLLRTCGLISLIAITLLSCSQTDDPQFESINEQIDYMIDQNRYEEALDYLDESTSDERERNRLREKVHLNYGLYSMNTFDEDEMRTRMNDALRQFIRVLEINSDNDVARTQIDQILQVYETIPDRQPEDDVQEGLREVGFNI